MESSTTWMWCYSIQRKIENYLLTKIISNKRMEKPQTRNHEPKHQTPTCYSPQFFLKRIFFFWTFLKEDCLFFLILLLLWFFSYLFHSFPCFFILCYSLFVVCLSPFFFCFFFCFSISFFFFRLCPCVFTFMSVYVVLYIRSVNGGKLRELRELRKMWGG